MPEYVIRFPKPHPKQAEFVSCRAPRVICRAGRRFGKTVAVSILAGQEFLKGRRVLYAAPTAEQVGRFWTEVSRSFQEPIKAGVFRKNETEHLIELVGTEQRIRAKTAWNAATMRGDYADLLILDEFQLMSEEAWGEVGAPMLLDNGGAAVFIYTPPSLRSRSVSKANDPQHAAKMFKAAQVDTTGRWRVFHFSSVDNPHLNREALAEISQDMTPLAYRQEILAEDVDEAPGALWTRASIQENRVTPGQVPELTRTLVAVDPSASAAGDEAGIIGGGESALKHWYILRDDSIQGRPEEWGAAAVTAARELKAPAIVAEGNQGGEMVQSVINAIAPDMPVILVYASDGKQPRAVPAAVMYAQGKVHHVGAFNKLEDEQCLWVQGDPSPNRLDALVWLLSTPVTYDGIERWAKTRRPR